MGFDDLMSLGDMLGGSGSSSGGGGLFGGGSSGGGLLGGLGGLLSGLLGGGGSFIMVVAIIFLIALVGALYTFIGFTLRNIGRKAGLEKDWMAFVPFARSIYRLQIVGEAWWKMFFLEYSWLWYIIINWIFGLFNNSTMTTFGSVLSILFLLSMIAYNLYYRNKYYKAFGLKPELALGIVTPGGVFFFTWTVDCLIAYTGLIQYGEATESKRIGEILHQQPKPNVQRASAQDCGLTGLSGMYAGQTIPMASNDDLVIGRDSVLANVIIDQNADKISRKHCVVRFDSARSSYTVTDFSTNGTFIDGGSRLVANVPTTMQRGAVIALGSRENRFKLN